MTGRHTFALSEAHLGRLRLTAAAAALCRSIDDRLLRMALDSDAVECRFPTTLVQQTLIDAGYFEAFPDGATRVAGGTATSGFCLCPAVCYHVYDWLRGRRLDTPVTATAAGVCFRNADRGATGTSRLWEFTMREVVFAGPDTWVTAQLRDWSARARQFAAELGLPATLEPATDPFFGAAGKGRQLMQQLKDLKQELRVPLDGQPEAISSFNRHETFFSSRFAMTLPDGSLAATACAAFGLERWALAVLEHRGAAAAAALVR